MPYTATDPQTGKRVQWNGTDWVPLGDTPAQPSGVIYGQRPQREVEASERANQASARDDARLELERERVRLAREAAAREAGPSEAQRVKAEKEARAREAMAADATAALDALQQSRGLIGQDVRIGNDALHTGWFNGETGPIGAMARGIPGTRAYDLDAQLKRIKAVLSTGKMAEMRANSPTGGAVGNPAVAEWDMLANSVANLDLSQSADQLKKQLDFVEQHLRRLGGMSPAERPAPSRATPAPPRRGTGVGANVRLGDGTAPARRPAPRRQAPAKPIDQLSDEELARIARGG